MNDGAEGDDALRPQRLPPLEQVAAEWERAMRQVGAAAHVLIGGNVWPMKEFFSAFNVPPVQWPAGQKRVLTNLLTFRANYAQFIFVWWGLVILRYPFRALLLLPVVATWFHIMVVRRRVLNVSLGNGKVLTIMGFQLLSMLSVATVIYVVLAGCLQLLLLITGVPVISVFVHAAVRTPSFQSELESLRSEFLLSLHSALREKDNEAEEMEGGAADLAGPQRDPEMARRVEEIRKKYRAPTAKSKKVSLD